MGCAPYTIYNLNDTSVIARAPSEYSRFPCGTKLELCGTAGCINGVVQDACPGCGAFHLDLSRAGFNAVCGVTVGSCAIKIRVLP